MIAGSDEDPWAKALAALAAVDESPEGQVISFLERMASRTVGLDIGCGYGRHTLWAARHGFQMAAVDACPYALDELRRQLIASGLTARVHEEKMTHLSFPDSHFDFALAWCSLNHGRRADFHLAIREAIRVLRPGGRFLAMVLNDADPRYGKGVFVEDDCFRFTDGPEAGVIHYFPGLFAVCSSVPRQASIRMIEKITYEGPDVERYYPGISFTSHFLFELERRVS